MEFEVNLIKFLQTGLSNAWISFFQTVTLFGSWLGIIIAFFVIFYKKKVMALLMLFTIAFASVINYIIKNIVCKPRPFDTYDFIVNYGGEAGFSMPSGHSVCVAVIAIFLCVYAFQVCKTKTLKILASSFVTLLALLVAFSRMVLGVHYLTDVLIGLIEGTIIASILLLLYFYYMNKLRKIVLLNRKTNGEDDE